MFKKVYIVDDDEVTLYLGSLLLSLHAPDCICQTFLNGSSGLEQIKQDLLTGELPDVMFIDLNMPYTDGFELLNSLDKIFADKAETPLVYVLTSSINKADKLASLRHNQVIDVIEKPLTEEKLHELESQQSSNRVFRRTVESNAI